MQDPQHFEAEGPRALFFFFFFFFLQNVMRTLKRSVFSKIPLVCLYVSLFVCFSFSSKIRAFVLFQLFQLVYQLRQYFSWENLLEWSVYVLAIVYIADEFQLDLLSRYVPYS